MKNSDSHLSTGGAAKPAGPIPQHKLLAMGKKVTGTGTNPNGAKPSTDHKVGNAKVTY